MLMKKSFQHNKAIDLSIKKDIPKDVLAFIDFVTQKDFSLTLIGGSVRDYILNGQFGLDFDFELQYLNEIDSQSWQTKVDELYKEIQSSFPYHSEVVSYKVLKCTYKTLDIEIAPARKEKFKEGEVGHKNFDVEFIAFDDNDEKQKLLRRDFTINAIGIEFRKNEILFKDYLNGVNDLENSNLQICSDTFYKDPVRFLRAIRFKEKFYFKFSSELEEQFQKMNLSEVSAHYFKYEASKIGFSNFFKEFDLYTKKYRLEIPKPLAGLSYESSYGYELNEFVFSLFDTIAQEKQENILNLGRFLGIQAKVMKRLISVRELINNEKFIENIKSENNFFYYKEDKFILDETSEYLNQMFSIYKSEQALFEKLSSEDSRISNVTKIFKRFDKVEIEKTVKFCRKYEVEKSSMGVIALLFDLGLLSE
tara:strand:+ start:70423 stop:71685 length:1263 start_codon:yes stop_codon:yes gene_type:complete